MEDAKLCVVFDEQIIYIKTDGSSELIKDLEYNQVECNRTTYICHLTENVIIHAPETDVIIIAISISTEISGNLCSRTDTKSNARIISVEKKHSLMLHYDLKDTKLLLKSLLSFYAFTGCDTECILW